MAVPASWSTEALPIPRTRLVGRESERATARSLLLDEAVPLLTLTGPGGTTGRSGTEWSCLLNWVVRRVTTGRAWIYGVSGRYGAARPILPTKSGRFGWPRSWRTAWDSPVWNQ